MNPRCFFGKAFYCTFKIKMEDKSIRAFLVVKGLLLAGLGFVFIVWPGQMAAGIAFYVGLLMLVGALVALFYTYRINQATAFSMISYIAPISVLIGALILLFLPQYALSVFAFAIGLWVLMDGVNQIRLSRKVGSAVKGMGTGLLVMGIVSLIIGVVIVLKPYELVKMMTLLFGMLMLISGALEVYSAFRHS